MKEKIKLIHSKQASDIINFIHQLKYCKDVFKEKLYRSIRIKALDNVDYTYSMFDEPEHAVNRKVYYLDTDELYIVLKKNSSHYITDKEHSSIGDPDSQEVYKLSYIFDYKIGIFLSEEGLIICTKNAPYSYQDLHKQVYRKNLEMKNKGLIVEYI